MKFYNELYSIMKMLENEKLYVSRKKDTEMSIFMGVFHRSFQKSGVLTPVTPVGEAPVQRSRNGRLMS